MCISSEPFYFFWIQKSRANNAACFVHAGTEGAVLGVPPAVLRVDRRVVRHDRGADTGDGAADGHAAEEGRCL